MFSAEEIHELYGTFTVSRPPSKFDNDMLSWTARFRKTQDVQLDPEQWLWYRNAEKLAQGFFQELNEKREAERQGKVWRRFYDRHIKSKWGAYGDMFVRLPVGGSSFICPVVDPVKLARQMRNSLNGISCCNRIRKSVSVVNGMIQLRRGSDYEAYGDYWLDKSAQAK